MAYIPLIKKTQWIDLSREHELIRNRLEESLRLGLVEKQQGIDPIMIKGAFGIGKTNTLYYLFHYSWCELGIPALLISLDELVGYLKFKIKELSISRIQNIELGKFVGEFISIQIDKLRFEDWKNIELKGFPDFSSGNFSSYLEGFTKVVVTKSLSGGVETFSKTINEKVIKEVLNKPDCRTLLLIDEFEAKYYEFKKIVDSSGGGVLRELYEQINKVLVDFFLVIGNGPASGYEIERDKGLDDTDSGTAENRRLNTSYALPFPTSNLLQRSFLKGDPKGYINFIWWLSRCRPGHILKLRDALGSIEDLKPLSFSELITKLIFKEPIDEGGEAVSYLKTQFFNEVNGRVQATILNTVLTEFQPFEFDIKDLKHDLRECIPYFICSSVNINTEIDLISSLRADLYTIHLKKYQEDGKFDSVNYIEHIQPYFSYILSGISDANGNMAFGMINDSKPEEVFATTFLTPLLELTYDFISLYQDDSVKETRESLDFLLHLINSIRNSQQEDSLELFVPNTFFLFEKCRLLRYDRVHLQLSLYAIRESIEQPIGSPKLKYKNEFVSELIRQISLTEEMPLILYKEENLHNYFIPALEEELLDNYLGCLQKHLYSLFNNKFHQEGQIVIRVIYFEPHNKIKEFRTNLLFKDGNTDQPEPIYLLHKIDVVDLESYQLNFGGQIRDYIDSVSQISLIGNSKKEQSILSVKKNDNTINLKDVIKVIGERPWTEKKENIRTIEHYRKLLFDGNNSTFKSIHKIANDEYKAKLEEAVCNAADFKSNVHEYCYLEKVIKDEAESYDPLTTELALLFLFENKGIDENLKQLLELCKSEYRFDIDKENATKGVSFKNLLSILTKNKRAVETHFIDFDLNSSFISKLRKFTALLLNEHEINGMEDYFSYLKERQENSFIKSYHYTLGGYLLPEITNTLYNLNYLECLSISDTKTSIINEISMLDRSLGEVRVNIVSKLDDLKSILDEEQNLSSYTEKLNKAIKGIVLMKTMIDKEVSHSTLLIINSVIKHLTRVVCDSKKFLDQLEEIYNDIANEKKKIDTFQEEIDSLYNDHLTEKLLNFSYPKKRTDNYLWNKNFLADNLKNREEFEKLFGETKNYYNPFTSPTIYPDKIDKFYQCLGAITSKLTPGFNDMLLKMREIKKISEGTTQLKNYINQLLMPVEE